MNGKALPHRLGGNANAWKRIWSAGRGFGVVWRAESAGVYIEWLTQDYAAVRAAKGMPV